MVDVQMAIVLLLSFGTASHQLSACKDNWYCFCEQMEELSYSIGRETQAGYYGISNKGASNTRFIDHRSRTHTETGVGGCAGAGGVGCGERRC